MKIRYGVLDPETSELRFYKSASLARKAIARHYIKHPVASMRYEREQRELEKTEEAILWLQKKGYRTYHE